jgi:hypothetical protein
VGFVLWLADLKPNTHFRCILSQVNPNQITTTYRSVTRWDKRPNETGKFLWHGPPRCTVSRDNVKWMREAFQRSPRKFVHFSCLVRAFLDRDFPDRCMGRRRPIPLPSRSLGFTPLDFFWRFVKDTVYCEKVPNVNELHDIRQSCTVRCQWNACQPVYGKK